MAKQKQETRDKEEISSLDLSTAEEMEIKDYEGFNPLCDFKLIRGKFFAIQSTPIRKKVAVEKNGSVETEWITTWKTYYSDESGDIQQMENNTINGEILSPEFSAETFLNYRKALLHRNTEISPSKTTIEKVYGYVKNTVRKILTLSDDDLSLLSCWIISAHFHRVFAQFPPLIFGKAGADAGGTTALMTTALIPYLVSIFDPTEATLFRLSQFGFSLLMDEIDPNDRDRSKIKTLNLILDGSFSKSATIPRATGKDFSVELFAPYSPKAMVDPYTAMTRPSTLSRSVRIFIKRDPNKSINLEQKEFISQKRDLIGMLYGLFLPYAHKVRKAYDDVNDFTGRLRQAYAPVIAIANIVGCHDQIVRALKPSMDSLDIARENDPVKFVLFKLYEFLKENRDNLSGYGSFRQSRDKESYYIELTDLRKELSDRASEVHQIDLTDTSKIDGKDTYTNRREWKKIPLEFKLSFEASTFNQIIKNNLQDFVKKVRGSKWGLTVNSVDEFEKLKDIREVDPVLDEVEKILGIEKEQSYKKDNGKEDTKGTVSKSSTTEETLASGDCSDDDDPNNFL